MPEPTNEVKNEETEVHGLYLGPSARRNPEIYLLQQSDIFWMMEVLFHEAGHSLQDKLSFKSGDVLSPAEVETATVPLTSLDKAYILALFQWFDSQNFDKAKLQGFIRQFADRILDLYTKGEWSKQKIRITSVNEKGMERAITDNINDIGGFNQQENGGVTPQFSRKERNQEISSIKFQQDCKTILQNSLKVRMSPSILYDKNSSHGRAQRIIQYLERKGWQVPSIKDIEATQS